MVKLDHLSIPVRHWRVSRDWYVGRLGFVVDFEVPDGGRAGLGGVVLQDDAGLVIFLEQVKGPVQAGQASYGLQVDNVVATFERLVAEGVTVVASPGRQFWGYGAEIADPDGHRLYLWDEASIRR